MKRRLLLTLALICGLLLAPQAVTADSHATAVEPITWISYVMSQPGKGTALSAHIAKGGAKIYDGLMADGHVLSWGVAMPINHWPGDDWNVMEWVTLRDWAALDVFMQAFMGMQMAKSPEQLESEQKEWYSLIEPGSHYDEIYRHRVFHVSEGELAYFRLGFHTPKPGQFGALTEVIKKYYMPVLAKQLEAGSISSYGLASPTVHGGASGTHVTWYGMPNLAAHDAVRAGFGAAAEERGEEAQAASRAAWEAATEWSAHHDRVLLVTHNGGGGGDAEGGDDEGGDDEGGDG